MWFFMRFILLFVNKFNKDIFWCVYVMGFVYIIKIFKFGVLVVI